MKPIEPPINTEYTDGGFWTPQTVMLQSLRSWISECPDPVSTALSIDENPTLEAMLRDRWPQINIRHAIYPECDAHHLSQFDHESFDLVYSHQVLEHLAKPWIAAAEWVRVLKPGGIGIHTTCAYNPRHGLPAFNDFYRFLPDGLAELFDGVEVLVKSGWGNRQALLYNLAIDDGYGSLGGRRFHRAIGQPNDPNHPWVTWIIFHKNPPPAIAPERDGD